MGTRERRPLTTASYLIEINVNEIVPERRQRFLIGRICMQQIFPMRGSSGGGGGERGPDPIKILCKVLEHIVTTNVVSHMDHHNLLYDLQHGFRSKRTCDSMRNSLAGSQTDLVLLDVSKAFDKVSHQKLLLKLH